jgi:signal transduction histidine kinase
MLLEPSNCGEKRMADSNSLVGLDRGLQNFRSVRFDGGLIQCDMSAFHPDDQQLVRELYAALQLIERHSVNAKSLDGQRHSDDLASIVHELGDASRAPGMAASVQRVLHDVRGGSLFVLIYTLSEPDDDPVWSTTSQFLAADHMKNMRNAIRGLDDAALERELSGGNHGVAALERRWTAAALKNHFGSVNIRFDAGWRGDFAHNCYEFAAVQRVVYNLLSNACRFTADQTIDFHIDGRPGTAVSDVRFAISNLITQSQESVLQEQLRSSGGIFGDGESRTSEGLGLGICADFVAAAYGLEDRQKALDGEYLGVNVEGNRFTSWFHWPVLASMG